MRYLERFRRVYGGEFRKQEEYAMGGKPIRSDLQTFIASVNKKDKTRNGKKIRFNWLKKKR